MSLKKMRLTAVTRAALTGVGLVVLVAVAMLVARRGPGVLAKVTAAAESPAQDVAPPAPKILLAQGGVSGPLMSAAPARTSAPRAAKPAVVKTAATTMSAAAAPESAAAQTAVVRLTGCLQHDDGTFRLKDTAGEDAPKARSWKSGFLKKRAASVEVVDSANRLGLSRHVGQRVTVTGVILDKEMRARAVQRVGACS